MSIKSKIGIVIIATSTLLLPTVASALTFSPDIQLSEDSGDKLFNPHAFNLNESSDIGKKLTKNETRALEWLQLQSNLQSFSNERLNPRWGG